MFDNFAFKVTETINLSLKQLETHFSASRLID